MAHIDIRKIIPLPVDRFYKDVQYNAFRRANILNFNDALQAYDDYKVLEEADALDLVAAMEQGCFDRATAKAREFNIGIDWECRSFTDIYNTFCYKIMSIFHDDDDIARAAIKRVISGEVPPNQLALQRITDLCPEQHADILGSLSERYNVQSIEKHSSLYRCRKCKRNMCSLQRMYNRALDEGQNIKITCLFCNYSWVG